MENAFTEAIENAVAAAVDKAIPASVNHAFVTAVNQAVKEEMKGIEPAIEKRIARASRKAELEERLEQLCRFRYERACLINFGPKSWTRWLENKNEEDEINTARWRSELDELRRKDQGNRTAMISSTRSRQTQMNKTTSSIRGEVNTSVASA